MCQSLRARQRSNVSGNYEENEPLALSLFAPTVPRSLQHHGASIGASEVTIDLIYEGAAYVMQAVQSCGGQARHSCGGQK